MMEEALTILESQDIKCFRIKLFFYSWVSNI